MRRKEGALVAPCVGCSTFTICILEPPGFIVRSARLNGGLFKGHMHSRVGRRSRSQRPGWIDLCMVSCLGSSQCVQLPMFAFCSSTYPATCRCCASDPGHFDCGCGYGCGSCCAGYGYRSHCYGSYDFRCDYCHC